MSGKQGESFYCILLCRSITITVINKLLHLFVHKTTCKKNSLIIPTNSTQSRVCARHTTICKLRDAHQFSSILPSSSKSSYTSQADLYCAQVRVGSLPFRHTCYRP